MAFTSTRPERPTSRNSIRPTNRYRWEICFIVDQNNLVAIAGFHGDPEGFSKRFLSEVDSAAAGREHSKATPFVWATNGMIKNSTLHNLHFLLNYPRCLKYFHFLHFRQNFGARRAGRTRLRRLFIRTRGGPVGFFLDWNLTRLRT
jgi:hypothetical protein